MTQCRDHYVNSYRLEHVSESPTGRLTRYLFPVSSGSRAMQ